MQHTNSGGVFDTKHKCTKLSSQQDVEIDPKKKISPCLSSHGSVISPKTFLWETTGNIEPGLKESRLERAQGLGQERQVRETQG